MLEATGPHRATRADPLGLLFQPAAVTARAVLGEEQLPRLADTVARRLPFPLPDRRLQMVPNIQLHDHRCCTPFGEEQRYWIAVNLSARDLRGIAPPSMLLSGP